MKTQESSKYQFAKDRVRTIKAFYTHLITYIVIIGFLLIFNFGFLDLLISEEISSNSKNWIDLNVLFCAVGWGVAVGVHALSVFVKGSKTLKRWEEKRLREIMDKDEF